MSFIFLVLILSSCTLSLSSAGDDRWALLKIKEQLGNPDILSSWVEGFDFCNGDGDVDMYVRISCSSSGRVVGLSFSSFLVYNASFPRAVCNLTELELLSIEKVWAIKGPIPSCINNLVHLQYFSTHRTYLGTPVPQFLNNKNLITIDLSQSSVYGPIPPSLSTSSLPKLETLDLSNNGVNGSIPWELAHNPPAALLLNDNWMSGELPSCATWKNLKFIALEHNQFSGDASSLFGEEKTVTYIDLSFNQFEFDLSNVQLPENLTHLDLSYNGIYGKVPESLAWHPVLSLDLKFNSLCGEIPQGGNMSYYGSYSYDPNPCLCGHPLPPCSTGAGAPQPAP